MSPSPPKSWPPPPPSPRFLNESLMYTVVATTGIDDCDKRTSSGAEKCLSVTLWSNLTQLYFQ